MSREGGLQNGRIEIVRSNASFRDLVCCGAKGAKGQEVLRDHAHYET